MQLLPLSHSLFKFEFPFYLLLVLTTSQFQLLLLTFELLPMLFEGHLALELLFMLVLQLLHSFDPSASLHGLHRSLPLEFQLRP